MGALVLLFVAALLGSWLLTGLILRYALARSVLDVPNHRSSHTTPTPRGGGLAIACIILLGTASMGVAGLLPRGTAIAIAGGGAAIAGIGWLDDHQPVAARWRGLVHLGAAAWALYWVGGMPHLSLGVGTLQLGVAGVVLAALGIVWFTNLYNFMDGIDGIAAVEAVSAGLIAGTLLWLASNYGLAALSFLIAAASGGFLLWNWQPAKIFMGDVGSGLLGFLFAVLAVASENAGSLPVLAWVLICGVFVWDATATLIRRVVRGEAWFEAHRLHAYQRAVQGGWAHARVTRAVLLINIVLAAFAVVAWHQPLWLLPGLLSAAGFLAVVYHRVERFRPMWPRPQPTAALPGSDTDSHAS